MKLKRRSSVRLRTRPMKRVSLPWYGPCLSPLAPGTISLSSASRRASSSSIEYGIGLSTVKRSTSSLRPSAVSLECFSSRTWCVSLAA